MFKTNLWNKIRYTAYLPVYDLVTHLFANARKKSIQLADIKSNDRVLIIGAGSGLDLPYLIGKKHITATDITPGMIRKLNKKAALLNLKVNSEVMDGQNLKFEDNSFDVVILHLILAVIPDPVKCIQEAARVMKPDGRIAVFDKFLTKSKAGVFRKISNIFSIILFTDINRKIDEIVSFSNLTIKFNEPALFNGFFRVIQLVQDN